MDSLFELKNEIVDVCKSAFNNKLFAGTSGNLSIYLREKGVILITPTSVRYETMKADDIVVITIEGEILEGSHKASSEWPMHTVVYEKHNEINAIFHTHSPFATAFATVRQSIPLVLVEMIPFLGGSVHCAKFEKPGTRELGLAALEELKEGRHACLLANHGVVAVGNDLAQAHIRAEYVEDAAMIYHHALQIAEPVVLG